MSDYSDATAFSYELLLLMLTKFCTTSNANNVPTSLTGLYYTLTAYSHVGVIQMQSVCMHKLGKGTFSVDTQNVKYSSTVSITT